MNKKELKSGLAKIFAAASRKYAGQKFEPVNDWQGTKLPNPIVYGAVSEKCMERFAEEVGKKRHTTFMSDLSVGEWFGVQSGLFETIDNAVVNWVSNRVYISEFLLCLAWKSSEHYARGNSKWSALYSELFEKIRDLVYRYHSNDEEMKSFIWQYLD